MRAEMEPIWSGIHDVWADNLEQAFREIRLIVKKYPYIGFDTEFPGVVAMPIGEFGSMGEYQYQILRCNVDLLKMIQLGLTFFDERGHPKATYQFNFRFNIKEDMFAEASIDLLVSSGLAFERHAEEGIDPFEFAQLLITSGVVLCDGVHWLCFHAGYDFGYLLKLLTEEKIPEYETQFFERLKIYFPTIYDIKYLMKSCKSLRGGLQEVADQLNISRIGPQHTAGSDSLLTGAAFFKMREMFFEDNIDASKYSGHLFAIGSASDHSPPATA